MSSTYQVALIEEAHCIGCAKCLAVCPTDAIVGAQGYMHTVITAECIGCELCLPPCPVDCITLVPVATQPYDSKVARQRVKARKARLVRWADDEAAARTRKKAYDPLAKLVKKT